MSDELVNIFKFATEDASRRVGDGDDASQGVDVDGLKGEAGGDVVDALDENADVIDYHDIMTDEFELNDTRIAMIGNVDSGKSTLIGVLTNAALDDGRGGARSLVLKHRHEQENGRTSAVTVEIMGYKGEEQVLPTSRNHAQRWNEVMEKSDHSVTLIDLCGHERYLKTTLFGLTGLMPDYCLLVRARVLSTPPAPYDDPSIAYTD